VRGRTNSTARLRLEQGLASCPIFIVDLRENTNALLQRIRPWLPKTIPSDVDVFEIANSPKTITDVALGLLMSARQAQIGASALGSIEALMSDDFGVGTTLRRAGLADYLPKQGRQFDRRQLLELSDKDFDVLVGRFAAAIGDALSPEEQIRAITDQLGSPGYLDMGRIACRALSEATSHDHVFDTASSRYITQALWNAHTEIRQFVDERRTSYFQDTMRPGVLREDDSKNVLGIQVADIAAGVAADLYERSGLRSVDAARHLSSRFNRVFLNRRWIS
jgi:hypothetical protein